MDEKKTSHHVNENLTKKDKGLITYVIISLIVALVCALAVLGTGIYAIIDTNNNEKIITNELAFIQKTAHDDGICISIDINKKIIAVKCPVVINTVIYDPVALQSFNDSQSTNIDNNNEDIRFNFQSKIQIPGMSFSYEINPSDTPPNDAINGVFVDGVFESNEISITNKFIVDSTGSLIFGNTGTIARLYPATDYASALFSGPNILRAYNLFFVGSFDSGTSPSTRCNSAMGLISSSIYILLDTVSTTKICNCVPLGGGNFGEYCTSPLKSFGNIL